MSEPNYKETVLEGTETSWRRAFNITVRNPYGVAPTLSFDEEDVTLLPSGKLVKEPVMGMPMTGQPMTITFDQNNPAHVSVYTLLNDLYVQARESRDALIIAQVEAEAAHMATVQAYQTERQAAIAALLAAEAARLAEIEAAENNPPVEPPA